jgi:hypothetical protein
LPTLHTEYLCFFCFVFFAVHSILLIKKDIYPPGGFLKKHKDTPHGANHLGSLVVVLSYPHEGGKLVIKQGHKEDVF